MDSPTSTPPAPFQLPDFDAPLAEWDAALARLNAVQISYEQILTGHGMGFERNSGFPDIETVQDFCREEGLEPVEAAAEALLARAERVYQARHLGLAHYTDLELEAMALAPLTLWDFGLG